MGSKAFFLSNPKDLDIQRFQAACRSAASYHGSSLDAQCAREVHGALGAQDSRLPSFPSFSAARELSSQELRVFEVQYSRQLRAENSREAVR